MSDDKVQLLDRIVTGPKPFYAKVEGVVGRIAVQPGEKVKVTPAQAAAFSHCLVDAKVAAARKAADQAVIEAEQAAQEARNEEAKSLRDAQDKASGSSESTEKKAGAKA